MKNSRSGPAIFACAGILICATFVVQGLRSKSKSVRAARISPELIHLGVLVQGDIPDATALLSNATGGNITVTGVTKSCACTTASVENTHIKNGESCAIKITVNTEGRIGKIGGTVGVRWIRDRDSSLGETEFSFDGDVKIPFAIDKRLLDFGDVQLSDGKKLSSSFLINTCPAPIEWDNLEATTDTCDVHTTRRKSGEFVVDISFDPAKAPIGRFKDRLRITLSNNGVPLKYRYQVPISGNIVSNVFARPATIFLTGLKRDSKTFGEVKIASNGASFNVESVKTSDPEFIKVVSVEKLDGVTVLHYVAMPQKPGGVSGKLFVMATAPQEQTIVVPFIAYVRE